MVHTVTQVVEIRHREPLVLGAGALPNIEDSIPKRASEVAVSLILIGGRTGFYLGRAGLRRARATVGGRVVAEAVAGAAAALATEFENEILRALRGLERRIEGIISALVRLVVESLGSEPSAKQIDELLDIVDFNAVIQRIDLDALLEGVDIAGLAHRARIGDLITESTSDVAGTALSIGRRQAVGVDTLIGRTVDRLLGRPPLDHHPESSAPLEDSALSGRDQSS